MTILEITFLETTLIAICAACAIIIIGLIISLVVLMRKIKANKAETAAKAENVEVVDGVRYTNNKHERGEKGEAVITHRVGDFVLEQGKTYTARKNSSLLPGKYTVLSAHENVDKFNVRIGTFVREIDHAADIVLADGDKISAVSHPAILR